MTEAAVPDEQVAAEDAAPTEEYAAGEVAPTGPVEGATAGDEETIPPVLTPPTRYCPLELVDVEVILPEPNARLVLREIEGEERLVVIPIALADANAIVIARDRLSTPRPLTHELFVNALAAFGVVIETVRITEGDGRAFAAEIVLSGPTGSAVLDCRPTDGVALALRQELPVPLTIAASLLDQLGAGSG